jgi:DNA-binding LacI/PurR family transcriptional regulator
VVFSVQEATGRKVTVSESTTKSIPRYREIKAEIAGRIARAELLPGATLPTRDELASQYRTARATVNRALQELAREGLIVAGSGRRTFVAGPTTRGVGAITVVWNWPEDQARAGKDYLDPLFSGIRQACVEFMLEVNYRSSVGSFAEALQGSGGQGLLVIRPDYSDCLALERLRADGVSVVAVPGILDDSQVPSVSADNIQGMQLAVEHLIGLGHRDIAFVSLTATVPDHFERVQAFIHWMGQHGLPILPNRLCLAHEMRVDAFLGHVRGWLRDASDLPTAIIAGDFLNLLAVLRQLNVLGVRTPDDVSVMSFDDPVAAAHLTPALTVVRQDVPRLGYRAVERLMALIRGQYVPLADRIPTELIVRESTTRPRR